MIEKGRCDVVHNHAHVLSRPGAAPFFCVYITTAFLNKPSFFAAPCSGSSTWCQKWAVSDRATLPTSEEPSRSQAARQATSSSGSAPWLTSPATGHPSHYAVTTPKSPGHNGRRLAKLEGMETRVRALRDCNLPEPTAQRGTSSYLFDQYWRGRANNVQHFRI